ncbi:MAG: MarR family transcriptional regulator [Candidatus Azobacteroides sp.]|nr:MarR family transcriptional regulator [Candidatus Azobacteroides sp.]
MAEKEKSPFATDNLAEDSGFLMLQVSSLWADCHDRILKKYYDLSHMQYAVLASIYWLVLHSEKQVTQTILSQHTKINPMAISQMLKVLEAKGYIYRTTHLNDVRAKAVDLTQQGQELMNKAVLTILEVDTKFFQILGKNVKHFNRYMFELLQANEYKNGSM